MKVKLLLALAAALLFALGLWVTRLDPRAERGLEPGRPLALAAPGGESQLEGPRPIGEDAATGPTRLAVEAPLALATPAPVDPWLADLGGVVGRVVEQDATPVADIEVALVQVDANFLIAADWAALGETSPQLVVARTRTDDEGRFQLDGAYDASYQGLGIDLRGPRSTVRVVETQVHHGERVDLGDIVLRAGCNVAGRVVDERGAPAPGVRVRIAPAPPTELEALLPLELQDFRADCCVGISAYLHAGEASPVVEPPPLVRRHLDDLPVPTVWTDAEGRYRFEGAPVGGLLLAIDRRGSLGRLSVEATEPGENDLGDAVLRDGRTIEGRVVDMSGAALEGIEVVAGTEIAGAAAVLHPAGFTDAAGRFAVHGCPEAGNPMACARRKPGEPWVGTIAVGGDELEIELESAFRVVVRVVDAAGQPVSQARVEIRPDYEPGSAMQFAKRFSGLGAERGPTRFDEVEPGVYACAEVTPGLYEVSARAPDLSPSSRSLDLWPGGADVLLTCEPGRFLGLTVLDAATGAGVPGARASLLHTNVDLFSAAAVGRTDAQGRVRLGPFAARVFDWEEGLWKDTDGHTQVLVQHPRYADAAVALSEGTSLVEVALLRGGEVRGHIQWGPGPPLRLYMLVLELRESHDRPRGEVVQAFMPPRLGLSAIDGSFRFSNLAPGTYRLDVYERWLGDDPLLWIVEQPQPVVVHRVEDLLVETGIATPVSIDLSPDGGGQTARLEGSVRLDGRAVEGAEVRVYGLGSGASAKTDASGYYQTGGFLCAERGVRVRISTQIGDSRTVLHEGSIEPVVGSVHRLDVDAGSGVVHVRATSLATGAPLAGARVSAQASGEPRSVSGKTDAQGEARLTVVGAGEVTVSITAADHAPLSRTFALSAGAAGAPELFELSASLPCAGTCDLSAVDYHDVERAFILVQAEGFRATEHLDMDDVHDDGMAAFDVSLPGPGSYTVRFWLDGALSEKVSFELPAAGADDLVLRHP